MISRCGSNEYRPIRRFASTGVGNHSTVRKQLAERVQYEHQGADWVSAVIKQLRTQ